MITKIAQLKSTTNNEEVKALCENTISFISSSIYNGVTPDAQLEIERVALTNLFEGLKKYSTDKNINEWVKNQERLYSIKHLGVRKAINTLMEKEGKYNDTLSQILENFRDKLNTIPEVLLYESFISAMSGFNYLPAVNTELDAVAQRVSRYKNDVDISKIIETMKDTRSNYLLPLIEDVVENYLNNKNEQNKSFLKETLVKFSYDPFIRDIINIVMLDATQLQLEYANAACDIEEKLFSPVLYLGENEALFNVKGTYYIKKGNNISKVKRVDVDKLDESYRNLCDTINLPSVEISKKDIKVYVGTDNAVLNETETFINGKLYNQKQINESAEVAKWSGNTHFFNIVGILRENFNEIAELDFVKRVELKENENYAADVFKLRDNIFITTFDPINNKATFYRNINPIQAEKIMMEHMRFDISKTFEDILPDKEKILAEIEQSKSEYSDYIKMLEDKIYQFSNETSSTAKSVVEALQEELTEVKNDYKDYLNQVEEYTTVVVNENLYVFNKVCQLIHDTGIESDYVSPNYVADIAQKKGFKLSSDEIVNINNNYDRWLADNWPEEVNENLNITVQDDTSGKSYTVVVPTGAMAAKGEAGQVDGAEGAEGDEYGTEVGMASIQSPDGGAGSAVTFDADQSELISDQPSDDSDKVDMGADDVEAYADKVDAEAELEKPEETETETGTGAEAGTDMATGSTEGGESAPDLGTGTGTEGEESTELDLDLGLDTEEGQENTADTETEEDKPEETEEAAGAPEKNLERTNFNKDKNPNDLDEPKKIKKVYLKRPKKS